MELARRIPKATQITLWVRAGGRCEFDGCNQYLLEHAISGTSGNFAELAHVVAFKEAGPRGSADRPTDVHSIDNLMLLCAACHKVVDTDPDRFTVRVCRDFKAAHEDRIFRLTETSPDRRTVALVVKADIGGQRVVVSLADMQAAVSPRYLLQGDVTTIDLSALPDCQSNASWIAKRQAVAKQAQVVIERALDDDAPARHISVFALAPMPLLIALGRELSNKVPVSLYQRHRDTEAWTWQEGRARAAFVHSVLQTGSDLERVAAVFSLSGTIARRSLPGFVDSRYWIYEFTLRDQTPNPRFLNGEADLEAFRRAYMELLRTITMRHGQLDALELFPAVPAPIAVAIGRDVFPKVDPALRVHDYDKRAEGFAFALEVNAR